MIDWFDELGPEGRANAAKIITTAKKYGVPAEYALALARAENSDLSHSHTSDKGAIGLMQLMPSTAKELGVDPSDVDQNIDGSMRYLKKQIDANKGNLHLAAVGYNAGPNHAFFQGKAEAPDESLQYVNRINQYGGFTPQTEEAPAPASQPVATEEPQDHSYSGDAGFNAALGAAAGSATAPVLSVGADLVNAGMNRSREAKAAAEAAAAKATGHGSGVRNWVPTQYAEPISKATLSLNPNSEKHAADLAKFFDEGNRVVRSIPQGALPAQASPLIPAPTPKAPDPTMWQRAKGAMTGISEAANAPTGNWMGDAAKYLGKKSLSTGLGAVGLGGAALQGTDALERWDEGDYVGSTLGGLAAIGGIASMVPHPVVKGVGLGVEGAATAGQMGYDYLRNRAKKNDAFDFGHGDNYHTGGLIQYFK